MYYRSGLDDNTKWGAWVKLLDTGNSSISGNTITINGSSLTVSKYDHNHDYLVVNGADEKSFNSAYHNF
nr:MAG TPA: Riboflavin synthase alpha chain [Bacteriophage sp.]